MKLPVISVVIPAFNYAAYLPYSIGSIQTQTFSDWECIVIDDGSTDNTEEVMDGLMKKDPRIKYVRQPNSGPTVARNLGVSLAKGRFIQFLDADDLLESNKFEKQLAIMSKSQQTDIVYGPAKYFDTNNPATLFYDLELKATKTWMSMISGSGEFLIKTLLKSNIMVISSPLMRRELFDKFGSMDESLFFNEDWDLWLKFALKGAVFQYDGQEKTSVLVRVHRSYSKDNFRMFVYGLKVCLKYLEQLNSYSFKKILCPKINYHTKIIDQRIIDTLQNDKEKAIRMCELVYTLTGLKRYNSYRKLFISKPFWFCKLYAKMNAIVAKLKGLIIYGA